MKSMLLKPVPDTFCTKHPETQMVYTRSGSWAICPVPFCPHFVLTDIGRIRRKG